MAEPVEEHGVDHGPVPVPVSVLAQSPNEPVDVVVTEDLREMSYWSNQGNHSADTGDR